MKAFNHTFSVTFYEDFDWRRKATVIKLFSFQKVLLRGQDCHKDVSPTINLGLGHSLGYGDIMTWKRFMHYCPLVRLIHRYPVDSPHKRLVMRICVGFFIVGVNN